MIKKIEGAVWIFGAVVGLGITAQNIEYSPAQKYYVSNNWDTVYYKTMYDEDKVTSNPNFKIQQPPKEFSKPNDFISDNNLMSINGSFNLPVEEDSEILIDYNTGILTATEELPLYAPFSGKVVEVYPSVQSGNIVDINQIYTLSDGVTISLESDTKLHLEGIEEAMYLKLKLSSLSKTYASETHTEENAFTDIRNNLHIYYTDFPSTGPVKVEQKALLGRMGKTGSIPNKNIEESKYYVKIEVYRAKDKESGEWIKVPFNNIFKE